MKTSILRYTIIMLLLTSGFSCQKDETFLYAEHGEKEYFKLRRDKVIVKCESEAEAKSLSQQSIFRSVFDVSSVWIIATINPILTLDILLKMQGVVSATCGLEYDGVLHYPTDQIYVKFKEGLTPKDVLDTVGLTKYVESIELFDPYNKGYSITLNVQLGDILQICRKLFELGLCKCAEPTFILEMKPY